MNISANFSQPGSTSVVYDHVDVFTLLKYHLRDVQIRRYVDSRLNVGENSNLRLVTVVDS